MTDSACGEPGCAGCFRDRPVLGKARCLWSRGRLGCVLPGGHEGAHNYDDAPDFRPGLGDVVVGVKHDQAKPRWDLLPFDAAARVVDVLTFGAVKYGDRNWERGLDYGRVYAAAMRHLTAWWAREDKDPETGIEHLAHAACCCLFLLSYQVRGMSTHDNRPSAPSPPGGAA